MKTDSLISPSDQGDAFNLHGYCSFWVDTGGLTTQGTRARSFSAFQLAEMAAELPNRAFIAALI